ncbi:MAG: prenyltransferase/squalene oxidase repeat-containing protein [Planctomycetota bacterium]
MSSSSERPSKPNAKLKPNRKPALKRLDLGITLEAAPSETPSWFEEARHFLVTGGPGLLLSLALHGLILVSLAYVVIRVQEKNADPLALSWDPPGSPTEKPGRKRKPVVLPLDTQLPDDGQPPINRTVIKTTPAETSSTNAVAVQVGVKPVNVSGALGGRGTGGRGRGGGAGDDGGGGGTKDSDGERAITSGLMWLKRQQKSDGHWELHQGYPDVGFSYRKTDTGATALALLAFLGHGDTHQAGEHKDVAAKGLKWLRSIQDPASGDLHDMRQEEGRPSAMYAHILGTIVLCEALALTGDNELRQPAERAIKYILMAQHPTDGGWKYRPLLPEGRGDLSVTGWALMALHTARMAGIEIPQEEFERASRFLDLVQAKGTARYKYEPTTPDNKATAALTAEALLCRQWLGWPKNFPQMTAGVKYVLAEEEPLSWSGGRRNVYGWYYTAQMLHNLGGDDWIRWNTAAREAIIKNQAGGTTTAGKDTRGSWNPNSPPGDPNEHTGEGGRLYVTALCILILETPYRHQPLYEP